MSNQECLNTEFNKQLDKLECAIKKLDFREQSLATEWIGRLKVANSSIEEMQLRNDFITYLASCSDGGVFRSVPFNTVPPPSRNLIDLQYILPSDHKCGCVTAEKKRQYIQELFSCSLDNGNFLAEQPLPRDGTFFILHLRSNS